MYYLRMKNRRLLLLAMSGVRIRDPELLELGMTLPGFVERGKVIASLPSLSLLTVASFTPPNWEVHYKEIDDLGDSVIEEIVAENYDVVAVSSFTARILEAYQVSDSLRAQGITVVLGGLHVTALPDEASLHATSIVVGEAEPVWAQLLADFESNTLRQRYSSAGQPFDFCRCKVPRYDLLDISKYNRLTIQTTRGCPFHCSFCAASRLLSPYKTKPIEHIRKELEAILAIWPRPFIELADDNTFVNKRWAHQLVSLFQEYPLRWFTETDISLADDEALLEGLAKSGCAQVLIGLESSTALPLDGIDTKNWKHNQFESYIKKIEKIQSYGISVNGCFIIGHDADDASVFGRTEAFAREAKLSEVQLTILTPFPGTTLYHQLQRERRLYTDMFWDKCTLFDLTFEPKQMTSAELRMGFRTLVSQVYSDSATATRKKYFKECVRTRAAFKNALV